MDTHDKARLALALSADRHTFDGAWWPRSRALSHELVELFAALPPDAGYISRVIFCPRDWDDAPSTVPIPNRRGRVKTGFLLIDDTHRLVLMMLDGQRRTLAVIPHSAAEESATPYLRAFGLHGGPTVAPRRGCPPPAIARDVVTGTRSPSVPAARRTPDPAGSHRARLITSLEAVKGRIPRHACTVEDNRPASQRSPSLQGRTERRTS